METNTTPQATPTLSFGEAIKQVFNKYATFTGRARRSEYWYFALFGTLAGMVAYILDFALGLTFTDIGYGPLYILVALGLLIPGLAVAVRRLHDINKSGWNYLWVLIPIVGGILLIVWFCYDSKPETNKYGTSPKYID